MSAWDTLERELGHWTACGRDATMWWRDDDATVSTGALIRLLTLSESFDVPVALAAIPARLNGTLGPLIAGHSRAVILQHGYAHENHARPNDKKIELGPQRPYMHTLADLATGWQSLISEVGSRAIPVLVPPWNRVTPGLVPLLPEVGFRGLSQFGPRPRAMAVDRLCQANVHIDIIDWRRGHDFVGAEAALTQMVAHLEARRTGSVDANEPTGLMTHHAVHDAHGWRFVEELLTRVHKHQGIRWLAAGEVFRPAIDAGPQIAGALRV